MIREPDPQLAEELRRLAGMLRLVPARRDPERFHVERDHLERRSAALGRRGERERMRV